jgi:hypothetical protein
VFCLVRERWRAPLTEYDFVVEHLVPRSEAPERFCDYDNLLYACQACNCHKGDHWPVLDPCRVAYNQHLRVGDDGVIEGLSRAGKKLIKILRLDRQELTDFRRRLLRLFQLAQANPSSAMAALVGDMLCYPDDLPDLARLRPPEGNSRPEGTKESYFARREQLPPRY